jgi:hypothetical protein
MADLKPRQYKRLGRIAENNPERAARVAGRMEKRASREERGREVAGNTGRGVAKYRAASEMTRAEENPRAKAEAVKKMTEKGRTSSGAKPVNVVRGKVNRPDTPLAMTPEPFGSFVKSK